MRQLTAKYPLAGLSSQVAVRYEKRPEVDEPGTHGSVVVSGDQNMMALPSFNWVDAFRYDCSHP